MPSTRFFAFEWAETSDGLAVLEGLASVRPADGPVARAEAQAWIAQFEAQSPGPLGPLEEGGVWEHSLTERVEGDWLSLHLTVVGPMDWLTAWWNEQQFDD